MNWNGIFRNVGYALLVSALFMFLSMLISLAEGNDSALAALAISFTLTFMVGAFPFIFVRKTSKITMAEGYLTIVLSWLLSFIFGMLPYALWGGPFSLVDAWFESVSGFTTTGATVLPNVEALPDSLLFWRSATHFIGGLGVVVFLLLVIPESAPVRLRLANMELSALSKTAYRVRTNKTVYVFTTVYIALNVAAFLLYWVAGMSPFDAVNHAFSVCATGGFSTRNLSIASFGSPAITLITIFFMLAGSVHFGMVFIAFATRSLKPLDNPILKFYLGYVLVFSVIAAIVLRADGLASSWSQALLYGSFNMVSYASTTGLAICDNSAWPHFLSLLLMMAGAVCGMAGSTTGGIKADRILLLFKSVRLQIHNALSPNFIAEAKLGRRNIYREDVYPQILYIAIFGVLWIGSTAVALLFSPDNSDALMATLSSLSNVGPSIGALGSFGNYGAQPDMSKIVYAFDMFLGRVEIYPILAVLHMVLRPERRF